MTDILVRGDDTWLILISVHSPSDITPVTRTALLQNRGGWKKSILHRAKLIVMHEVMQNAVDTNTMQLQYVLLAH